MVSDARISTVISRKREPQHEVRLCRVTERINALLPRFNVQVGFKSAEVVEAELKAGIAQLTVKFVSELISATRDRAGVVIAGDPKRIREVTDIWTFAREIASRDPNWKLVATQAAN